MLTKGHELPPKFLQVKQDEKFISRLLAKEESSNGESSFRVLYYGGAGGAIPFTWESQPGTPKHTFSDTSLPPLTPPPSYQCSPQINTTRKLSKSKVFQSIFLRNNSKKTNMSHSYSSSSISSSCSSSYSFPSTPMNNTPFTSRSKFIPRSRSAIYFGLDEDDHNEQPASSPTSTLCFGGRNGSSRRSKGHYSVKNLRKAFLSIVGHGVA